MSLRWFRFILTILIGIAAGLLYAWVVNPVEYVDTTLESLRVDYKTDYVLMVAEAYRAEVNLDLAAHRLAFLGDNPPGEVVQQAISFAERNGYAEADLILMRALSADLQTWNPVLATSSP